jgi:hypothetical protein
MNGNMSNTRSAPIYAQNLLVVWCIISLIYMAGAGCNSVEIQSSWINHNIAIDGVRGSDWDGVMLKIDNEPVGVGFQNDSDYIYLLLTTYDQSLQRQIISGGFTVWFDRNGGDEKTFGIHFPLSPAQRDFSKRPELREGKFPEENTPLDEIPFSTAEMEITGPSGDKKQRVNINQLKQIEAKIDISNGYLTYELKVPLTDNGSDPYVIGTPAGATVGIGIETAGRSRERNSEFERRRRDAEEPLGGTEDVGMGRGGASDRVSRSGVGQTEPLSFWAKVKLAVKGS